MEALNLSSLDKNYLSEHIDKVFIYDRLGMRCNLLISYINVADFSKFYDKYKEFVENYDYKYALLRTEAEDQYTNIRVIKTVHNREEQEIFLYHVLVYLQDK